MSDSVVLGKIVGSRDHSHYLVAVYREGEIESPPAPRDCAIGNFVKIGEGDQNIVGIIASSQIVSEEGLGMHFSPAREMGVFTPELLDGAARILLVSGIGILGSETDGAVETGIPSLSPAIHDPVSIMSIGDIKRFHLRNGRLNLGYLPLLPVKNDPGVKAAVSRALRMLVSLLPEQKAVIELMLQEIEWSSRVEL